MRLPATRLLTPFALLILLPIAGVPAAEPSVGRHIYVNPDTGNDRFTGLVQTVTGSDGPVKTIHHGVRRAKPGDTVHLAVRKEPYRESVVFHNAHGEPGKPIVFDGHGATIEGSEPLNVADWEEVSPGLYRNDHLLPARQLGTDGAVIQRWFFRIDGKMNFMGRTSKGRRVPLKAVADLQPGEWTFEQEPHAFFIKVDAGKQLSDYRIEAPLRSAGVQVSGDCSQLLIRNMTATHVYNDGYNIHGKCREVRFENIAAIECGDDGMSAHDDCQITVDGFTTLSNSTGLCDVNDSVSNYNRVYAEGNIGFDIFFLGTNRHSMKNSVIRCTAQQSVVVQGDQIKQDQHCTTQFENVLIERAGETTPVRFANRAVVVAERVTLLGMDVRVDEAVVTLKSVLAGGQPAPLLTISEKAKWTAANNDYHWREIAFQGKKFLPGQWADYQTASGQDQSSRWSSASASSAPRSSQIGADVSQLPPRPTMLNAK